MNIKEWTGIYLKHRDALLKKIETLKETPTGFEMILKDKKVTKVAVSEELKEQDAKDADIVVFLNTKKNAEMLARHWKAFTARDIMIISAHPGTNEKWIIRTQLHDRVADEKSLKQGFLSLTEAIGEC